MLRLPLTRRLVQWRFEVKPSEFFNMKAENWAPSHNLEKNCLLGALTLKANQQSVESKHKAACEKGSRTSPKLVSLKEAQRFVHDCFVAVKTPTNKAREMAKLLVEADYSGHQSHGMNRLNMYIRDIERKSINPAANPCIIKETAATAWVNGRNGLGVVVGNYCMDLAIKKAQKVGVAWVCAKHSNHYGMAGWYSLRAMRHGLLGISMTNSSPVVTPTRAKESALGTNPIAIGILGCGMDKFLLDMAASNTAVGKIEMQKRKGEPLPEDWTQDSEERVRSDAKTAYDSGCLLPLSGAEINAGYKGYGLSAMVDIFSGVLSGANYSTQLDKLGVKTDNTAQNLGHAFMVMDPNCFDPNFQQRLTDFLCRLKTTKPIDPAKPVLVPGDVEENSKKAIDIKGGIKYTKNQLKTCEFLALRLKIEPLKFI